MTSKPVNPDIAKLENFGKEIVGQIERGQNPTISLTVRSLSNVEYDAKKKKLQIGDKQAERSFFNVAHLSLIHI